MDNKDLNTSKISKGLPNSFSNIVLVDCMDTILYRDISLDYLFVLWAKKMGKEFNIYYKFLLYYRREVVKGKMHNTVPIDDIYGEIYDHCNYFGLIQACPKDLFISKAHNIELSIELKHHHLRKDTAAYLRNAKSNNSLIYCVSDFRLPSFDINQFFSNLGIENLFTKVFSSCDIGKTKKRGDLYEYVIESIHKNPSECIMIGDNKKSDCVNANKYGINSYWLDISTASKIHLLTSKLKSLLTYI